MTTHLLGNGRGTAVSCDGRVGQGRSCDERVSCGSQNARAARSHACDLGWSRGSIRPAPGRASTLGSDFCPSCAPRDREAADRLRRDSADRRRRSRGESRRRARKRLREARANSRVSSLPGVPAPEGAS